MLHFYILSAQREHTVWNYSLAQISLHLAPKNLRCFLLCLVHLISLKKDSLTIVGKEGKYGLERPLRLLEQ